MTTNPDHLSIKSELERKVLEEMERLLFGLKTRRITHAQFHSSMLTLWNSVAGLVEKEVMEMISQAINGTPQGSVDGSDRTVWIGAVGAHMAILTLSGKCFTMQVYSAGVLKAQERFESTSTHPQLEAYVKFAKMSQSLIGRGFVTVQ